MSIHEFLSGFGIGAFVTAIVQVWITRKSDISKRNFQEKKESYIGLLEAYHRAAIEHTDEAAKNFAYWQMRCELVAPKEVRIAIQEIIEDRERRNLAHEGLKNVLRKDIGITS